MSKTIETGVFGITVHLDEAGGGRVVSDLRDGSDGDNVQYASAIDAVESLILAHACAGIDITSPAYLEGVETTIEAISNLYM